MAGGAALVLTSGAVGLGALLLPRWLEDRVQAELERRLHAEVSMERVAVDFEEVRVTGISVTRPDLTLEVPEAKISWTWEWAARPMMSTPRAVAPRGSMQATSAGVRAWIEEVAAGPSLADAAAREPSRSPALDVGSFIDASAVVLDVSSIGVKLESPGDHSEPRLSGEFYARGTTHGLDVGVRDLDLKIAGRRPVGAAKITTRLEFSEGRPALPITMMIEDGSAGITARIFAVDVRGALTVADAAGKNLSLDLSGGLEPSSDEAADEVTSARRGEEASPLWTLKAEGSRDLSSGVMDLELANFELGRAPQLLRRLPLVDSKSATVGGSLHFERAGADIETTGSLVLDGLNIVHPLLARDPVEGVGFSAELSAVISPAEDSVRVESLRITREAVVLQLEGALRWPEDVGGRAFSGSLSMPPTPCQSVLASIPKQLVPGLRDLELKGDMEIDLRADVDMTDLDALDLSGAVKVRGCGVTKVPRAVSRLGGGFVHRVMMKNGRIRGIDLTDQSMAWSRLEEISPAMVGAVLTTEDAGFFRHRGFLGSQFKTALRRNLRDRRVRLGASTVTMQLAKNLLLSHEKTLSRKLQEMVLTWLLERTYSKQRLMELYLNVVEFGPQIYGITAAAEHYFGKIPVELTSLESAWLALLLPSPVVRYEHYCAGEPSPAFNVKLRRIHRLMHSRGHIDELEYALWKDAPLVFSEFHHSGRDACMERRGGMLAGRVTQRAVSGLLEASRSAREGGQGAAPTVPRDAEPAPPPVEPRPAMDVAWEEAG